MHFILQVHFIDIDTKDFGLFRKVFSLISDLLYIHSGAHADNQITFPEHKVPVAMSVSPNKAEEIFMIFR